MRAVSPAIAAAERAIANGLHSIEFKSVPGPGGKARELVSAFIHGTKPEGATPLWMDNKTGTVAEWSQGMIVPTDPDGALQAAKVGQQHLLITASTPEPTWGAAMIADSLKARGHKVTYVPTENLAVEGGRLVDTRGGTSSVIDAVDGISVRTGAHLTERDLAMLNDAEKAGTLIFNKPSALENIRTKRSTAAFAESHQIAHPTNTFVDKGNETAGIQTAFDMFKKGKTPVVVKAVDDMGGHGMVFLDKGWSIQSARSAVDVIMEGKPGRSEIQIMEWVKSASGNAKRGAQDERYYFVRDGDEVYFPPNVMLRTGAKGKAQSNISADGKATAGVADQALLATARQTGDATGLHYGSIDFIRDVGPGTKAKQALLGVLNKLHLVSEDRIPKGKAQMLEVNGAAGYGPEENIMAGAPLHDITADMMIRASLAARSTAG
jgi:glutathione synthase/RimK-type ligase-like ATP-grasp enzyme